MTPSPGLPVGHPEPIFRPGGLMTRSLFALVLCLSCESDEIIRDTLVCHRGEVTNERIRDLLGLAPCEEPTAAEPTDDYRLSDEEDVK